MKARTVYGILLRVYDAELRRRYGAEMRRLFLDTYRDVHRTGSMRARFRFWLRTLRDTVIQGIGSRFERSPPLGPNGLRNDRPDRRILADPRAGLRLIRNTPLFFVFAVSILATGIAAATAIGMVTYHAVLQPPPYPDPDRVVIGWGSAQTNGQFRDVVSGPVAMDLIEHNTTLTALAAFKPDDAVVMRDGRPDVVPQLTVTTDFFASVGVEPLLGRWFESADGFSNSTPVVVLGHGYWSDVYGRDSTIIGRNIELDGESRLIVGVTRPDLHWPGAPDLIVPLSGDVLRTYDRTSYNYWLVGRLGPLVSMKTASEDLNRILDGIKEEDPRLANWSILIEPLREALVLSVRPALFALLVGVGFLWLIAVANVTSLFLIRTSSREQEYALHRALGASRARVVSIVLMEVLCVSGVAFAVAMAGASLILEGLRSVAPPSVPIPGSAASVTLALPAMSISGVLLGIGLALASFVIIVGPIAERTARMAEPKALGVARRAHTRSRKTVRANVNLVAIELMIATTLLIGAGLSMRTLSNMLRVDAGIDADRLLTMYVGDVVGPPVERARFFDDIVREVSRAPGVQLAAVTDYVPFQQEDDFAGLRFLDRPPPLPGEGPREEWRRVSAGYFATAGITLLRGRVFDAADNTESPSVAVVNQAFVDRYYPDQDPVGRRFLLTNRAYGSTEIVGVVGNVHRRGLAVSAPPVVYVPFLRDPRPNMALFVKTQGEPETVVDAVKEAIWRVNPGQPVDRVATMREVLRSSISIPSATMRIVGALGAVGLILAGAGVFGVMAYSVKQRQHEIGVRLALGANPRIIVASILRHTSTITAVGLISGFLISLAFGRGIRGMLFEVSVLDPVTIIVVAVVVSTASTLAAYIPARRAGSIDPVETLRVS